MLIISVLIHALDRAQPMLTAEQLTIVQFVLAKKDKRVILSCNAMQYVSFISIIQFCTIINNIFSPTFATAPPLEPVKDIPHNPCNPSPCGLNSECRDINGVPSCSCLTNYLGSPPNCHPECVINSECQSNKACVNEKCIDPCPGSCGINSKCMVINHIPICTCYDGYTGNPFDNCYPKPPERKNFFNYLLLPKIMPKTK